MNRIDELFARKRSQGARVLVAYVCVGDPSVEESISIASACAEAGADILELGCPFSDPTADGPVIARASQRALRAGGGFEAALRAARALRQPNSPARETPLVLFGYYNPLFVRGALRAADEVYAAGIDGLLVVDLPLEGEPEFRDRVAARGLAMVPLVAPTSSNARVGDLRTSAATRPVGFVYYVSVTGVTGSAAAPLESATAEAGRIRASTGLPVVVGFGVDSPEKATLASREADGVVVGTAIVRIVEEAASSDERRERVRRLVSGLRAAIDGR